MFYSSHEIELMNKYKAEGLCLNAKNIKPKANNYFINKTGISKTKRHESIPLRIIYALSTFKSHSK